MSQSPLQRAWQRFKQHKRAYWSLWLFSVLFVLSLAAEVLSNDRPLLVKYQGEFYFPILFDYNETRFGGDFDTPTDYLDPYIQAHLTAQGNWVIYAPNRYGPNAINDFVRQPDPAPPSSINFLGTDDRGRDILARLIYGFRISVLFALILTLTGSALGILMGAIQGYFGGKTDLVLQRLTEIWGGLPELYMLIILLSFFQPSLGLLLFLLSIFGWMGLADYVRAEFLKNRQAEYVLAARSLGLSNPVIMWRHLLPNCLTPVLAFLPFRVSGAILALTSLDFLGLGVQSTTASLGEMLAQGKDNLDAWWIGVSAFIALTTTLLLLIFIGEGLRAAMDTRKAG